MRSQAISGTRRTRAKSAAGFSLIELLIVVGIILVIASIAIPNYMKSRMVANEAAAVENIRTITTAETTYNISYGNGYAPTLLTLGGKPPVSCNNAALIDDVLAATGLRSGYNFSYAAGPVVGAPPVGASQCPKRRRLDISQKQPSNQLRGILRLNRRSTLLDDTPLLLEN